MILKRSADSIADIVNTQSCAKSAHVAISKILKSEGLSHTYFPLALTYALWGRKMDRLRITGEEVIQDLQWANRKLNQEFIGK